MKKKFVLDTSVLLHDPSALFSFQENDIVLYGGTLDELDDHKVGSDEKNYNARVVARVLDKLSDLGDITRGVSLEGIYDSPLLVQQLKLPPKQELGKIIIFSEVENILKMSLRQKTYVDDMLVNLTKKLDDENNQTVLVSKDTYLRIKAKSRKLTAQDYETDKKGIRLSDIISSVQTYSVSSAIADVFHKGGTIDASVFSATLTANQYLVIEPAHTLGRYDAEKKKVVQINPLIEPVYGKIRAKNKEQRFFLDAMFNPAIKLVIGIGKAGTGKTLLAIAAGLHQTTGLDPLYKRTEVIRPIMPLGNDIGYLPGEMADKIRPYMEPVYNALEFLHDSPDLKKGGKRKGQEIMGGGEYLIDTGLIKLSPQTYIRGSNITDSWIIVDEAQNLTPQQAKTVLTRPADGTKVIMLGDPFQIDNPYVDSQSNGLVYAAKQLANQPLTACVVLEKTERGELAELAAKLM